MRKISKFLREIDPIVHLFFLIAIIILFSGYFFLERRTASISTSLEKPKERESQRVPKEGLTLAEVNDLIAKAIATISAVPKAIVKTVVDSSTRTTYIPLGGTTTTTNTAWTDVEDAKVYIDVENDYGNNAKVSWEASLKVAHSNGQAFARLYDDTNKIVVLESEISTKDNSEFKQVSSGNLAFWKGRNLYKVQIKSLNSFEITYSGGRIKVSY